MRACLWSCGWRGKAEFGWVGVQVVPMNELQCVWLPGRTVKPAVTKMGCAAAAVLLFLSLSGESFCTDKPKLLLVGETGLSDVWETEQGSNKLWMCSVLCCCSGCSSLQSSE